MIKNKKGNIFFAIVIALILFMIGMLMVNFIKTEVTNARTDLTCTSPATDGTKILCLLLDSTVPYFMVLILSIALGVLTEKLLI